MLDDSTLQNMDLPRCKCLSIVLVFLSALAISNIDSGEIDERNFLLLESGRFKDISSAINFIHGILPSESPIEQRCIRYAILLDIGLDERSPFKHTVIEIAMKDDDGLGKQYGKISIDRLIYAYMSAIDRYRVTRLAPPFIDLVECLRRIDRPVAKAYLNNQELVVILDLYRQILGLNGTEIDIKSLDLTKFRHTFCSTLRCLFREYLDIDSIFCRNLLEKLEPDLRMDSKDFDSAGMSTSDSTEQERYQLNREQQSLKRRREQARLRQQRFRILNPTLIVKYKEEQRRLDQAERLILAKPPTTAEEMRAKQLIEEKRKRRNSKRRLRYRQLQEQRQYQQQLLISGSASKEQPPCDIEQISTQQTLPGYPIEEQQTLQTEVPLTLVQQDCLESQRIARPLVSPIALFPGLAQPIDTQHGVVPSLPMPLSPTRQLMSGTENLSWLAPNSSGMEHSYNYIDSDLVDAHSDFDLLPNYAYLDGIFEDLANLETRLDVNNAAVQPTSDQRQDEGSLESQGRSGQRSGINQDGAKHQ